MGRIQDRAAGLLRGRVAAPLLALLVMLLWGSLFPGIKLGYRAFQVDTDALPNILFFAGLRFTICGLALVTAESARSRRFTLPPRGALPSILCIALSGYVLHYALTYTGVAQLDGSKAAILKQTGSLFLVCFAFLFRREDRFTVPKLVGGLLGFLSILVVNLRGLRLSIGVYELLILLASVCSVISTVCAKRAYDTYRPMMVTAWAQLLGGGALLALGIVLGGGVGAVTWGGMGILAYLCCASCVSYALWNALLRDHDMSRLSVVKFAETLFAALCSWLLLGEDVFRWAYLAALLLACAGILVSSAPDRQHRR